MGGSRSPAGVVAGCTLGLASGWNIANIGAVASGMADAYGIALGTVGLLTTALFATHTAIQVPGGKISDAVGPRRAAALALAVIAAGDLIALIAPDAGLGLAARAITGVGTGLAFIAGSALVRVSGGSALAQGLFGGIGIGAGGLALAVVPQLQAALGWRAPYLTSLVMVAVAATILAAAGGVRATAVRPAAGGAGRPAGVLRERRLYRLAVLYAGTYGLSVVAANWVVELLERHSSLSDAAAAVVGALTLLLGIVSRPFGGYLMRTRPHRTVAMLRAGLALGALGTAALAVASPAPLAVAGGVLVGVGAGWSFAPVFTGAAATRPDAPAAAVGFVNGVANAVVLAGTPLVGVTFGWASGGRAGFAALAAGWVLAALLLPRPRELGLA